MAHAGCSHFGCNLLAFACSNRPEWASRNPSLPRPQAAPKKENVLVVLCWGVDDLMVRRFPLTLTVGWRFPRKSDAQSNTPESNSPIQIRGVGISSSKQGVEQWTKSDCFAMNKRTPSLFWFVLVSETSEIYLLCPPQCANLLPSILNQRWLPRINGRQMMAGPGQPDGTRPGWRGVDV